MNQRDALEAMNLEPIRKSEIYKDAEAALKAHNYNVRRAVRRLEQRGYSRSSSRRSKASSPKRAENGENA